MSRYFRIVQPALKGVLQGSNSINVNRITQFQPYVKQTGYLSNKSSQNQQSRNLSSSQWFLKHQTPLPEDNVIFIDVKGNERPMTYQELVEKAGERKVIKVIKTKQQQKQETPRYKIMSDTELEIALRKQKAESNYLGKKEILETEEGRIKQKTITLSEKISDHDLQAQLDKIKKLLIKGDFVKVNIKGSSKPDKHIELKQKVVDFFAEDQALLGQSGSKLILK